MEKMGNRVVFSEDEGNYIEDVNTGERIWMEDKGGMYTMKMWVNAKEKVAPF